MFYVNADYGRGLAQLFEKQVRQLGGEIVASVMHRNTLAEDDRDLIQATLKSFKQSNEPDLIVLFNRPQPAEWILQTVHNVGLKSAILGGDALAPLHFAKARPDLMDGVRVSQFFLPRSDDVRATSFVKSFRAFTGKDPDYGHAFAYDAVYLLRDAALEGRSSRSGVRSYLDKLIREKTQGAGVAGNYVFGPDHDARRELYIVEAQNGAHNLLKTLRVD